MDATFAQALLVGVLATAVLDAWMWLLARLGLATVDWAPVGRWLGHMAHGRFAHASIAKAPAVAFERAMGWTVHYAVGIGYAVLLVAWQGQAWLRAPTLPPALALGLATLVVPLLVMQPAMGAGFFSSRTPTPWRNRLRSLGNHAVFGLGLYLAAGVLARMWR
jgi:hypothetical protein